MRLSKIVARGHQNERYRNILPLQSVVNRRVKQNGVQRFGYLHAVAVDTLPITCGIFFVLQHSVAFAGVLHSLFWRARLKHTLAWYARPSHGGVITSQTFVKQECLPWINAVRIGLPNPAFAVVANPNQLLLLGVEALKEFAESPCCDRT